ncbi:MAG TPA: hypothetical protein GXZ30_08765 [Propionibacterium sp.]|jgi:hypothetical protein|nr:hypothetical protein [Propionibacterium sp.]
MTQITFRRGAAAVVLLSSFSLLVACSAPENAVVRRCEGSSVSGYDCTLTIERFDKPAFGSLGADYNKREADMSGTIALRSGRAEVTIGSGSPEDLTLTVTPDSPQEVNGPVRIARDISEREGNILIKVTPLEPSEGFSATLTYRD